MSVSSLLNTTIEPSGTYAPRFSRDPQGLWAKDAKGTAKKATTINGNIFFIIFPPFVNDAGNPPPGTFLRDIATNSLLRTGACTWLGARNVPRKFAIRELKSGCTI